MRIRSLVSRHLGVLVVLSILFSTPGLFIPQFAHAATITWDGGGADGTCGGSPGDGNKWSCALNWSGNTIPGSSDVAVFDGTSTKDSTIDSGFAGTVDGIDINSGYTGTITVATSLTVGASNLDQAAGNFNGQDQSITVQSDVIISGGGFTSTSGTLFIWDDFTKSGGSFAHNSGTVEFDAQFGSTETITGAVTFFNLKADMTSSGAILQFPASTTTIINGDLWLTAGTSNPFDPYTIESTSPGVQATINPAGTYFIHGLNIQDINSAGASRLLCIVRCSDQGNNTFIQFGEKRAVMSDISSDTTEAGGTATFTVALGGSPTASVTIPVSSSDVTEGTVSPSSLTFTTGNWSTPQTVTVTGVDDALNDGAISYSIVLGAMTSVDVDYGGMNPRDISVTNDDNDTPADTIDFDVSADFSTENIADELGIDWFRYSYNGHGFLETGGGGGVIDLTGTKVRAGCTVTIGGDDFTITRVWQESSTGEISITDATESDPESFDSSVADAAVTSIVCADNYPTGAAFSSGFVNTKRFASGAYSYDMVYDANNNILWNDDGNILYYNIPGDSTGHVTQGSNSFPASVAYDTTRGRLWYVNDNDDTVTVIDSNTQDYAFTDLPTSTFATCTGPESATYDRINDYVWVLCGRGTGNDSVSWLNASNGALLGTVTLDASPTVDFSTRGAVYDTNDDILWAVVNEGRSIVGIDGDTGGYAFGTLADSTFRLPVLQFDTQNSSDVIFSEITDTLWIINSQCDYYHDDYITKVDAATGATLGAYPVSDCPTSVTWAGEGSDVLYTISSNSGAITELRIADGSEVGRHHAFDNFADSGAVDDAGDVWVGLADSFQEYTRNGVPVGDYYSLLTNNSGQLDASTWTSITSAAVNETDDGAFIYYAVSFDGRSSYKVRTSGAWRTIASNKASDHGGVNGNWYYINDANSWTAAPSNTPEEALSLAMENGSVSNQTLTGAAINALSTANWSEAGAFSSGVTDTIDLAATFYTTDAHNAPSIQNIAFTAVTGGGGGGGGGSSGSTVVPAPTNTSVTIDAQNTCSPDGSVSLTLTATNATSVMVSNDSDFSTGSWQSFVLDQNGSVMTLPWTLAGTAGTQTVYARFRSSSGNVSSAVSDSISIDPACTEVPPTVPDVTEEPVETSVTTTGYVRTQDSSTVYSLMSDGTLRPFNDLQTYLTYADSCGAVTYVENGTLDLANVGRPMLPRPGSVLIQFPGDTKTYAIEADPTNSGKEIFRWITDESVAEANYGENWSDYVITIPVPSSDLFSFGNPIVSNEKSGEAYMLRSRAALNDNVSYNFYIVNPDGTKRYATSDFARVKYPGDGTLVYGFEDRGNDFDYNDVILRVDPRTCLSLAVSVYPLESLWHHQIGVQIFYEGTLKDDFILWQDSHTASESAKVIDLTRMDNLRNTTDATRSQIEDERMQTPLGDALLQFVISAMKKFF